ncbi:MAG: hypothetical protein AAFY19_03135 [Pseudomonadota bacterium]
MYNLVWGLLNTDAWVFELKRIVPEFDWNRDAVIVALSTRFTIVMIPVVAIWGFRSRIARILVTAMAILSVPQAVLQAYDRLDLGVAVWGKTVFFTVLVVVVVSLLFAPAAKHWFSKERDIDPATFS